MSSLALDIDPFVPNDPCKLYQRLCRGVESISNTTLYTYTQSGTLYHILSKSVFLDCVIISDMYNTKIKVSLLTNLSYVPPV